MAGPHDKYRGGSKPPSVIAAQPVARPEAPVSPVAATVPAPPALNVVDGDDKTPADAPPVVIDVPSVPVEPVKTAAALAEPAQPEPPKPTAFVAVCPIFVGGEKGRVEPGAPYKPTNDAERDLFLAQGVIRPV
jgi:hypothetical protein